MTPAAVVAHMQAHPRFLWLKRNVSSRDGECHQPLQGTVYVVNPGAVMAQATALKDEGEDLDQVVARLYKMLNDKGAPERISREEISRRLQPGAAPGPLGVKLTREPPCWTNAACLRNRSPGSSMGWPGSACCTNDDAIYPFNSLAAATLGFVSYDNHTIKGAFGLEAEEQTLHGVDGREIGEVDARHITIPRAQSAHRAGRRLRSRHHAGFEHSAGGGGRSRKGWSRTHANGGECLVMDPNNGEILAMASTPTWNSNDPTACLPGAKPPPLTNPIVSNFYEPGSTFKVTTVMAALEEGVIHDGEIVTTCTGSFPVGNRIIHDARSDRAHGQVDCGRILEQSCNIGAATLALRLGAERFSKWCRTLGFGQRTGIEVPNESSGYLNARNVGTKITLANMGFGQSLAVTPLQMLAAYSAVANGGYLVKPHLVKARMNHIGTLEAIPISRTQVCSTNTAALMRGYLERVVTKGTGKLAAIPGYRVAGKTGTAQKAGLHGYRGGAYVCSFIGIMPAEKPRLIMITVIDEPHAGSIFGSTTAAPVVQAVGQRALQYLNILPTVTTEKVPHISKK